MTYIFVSCFQQFLRDELKTGNSKDRKNAFHGNDNHISVDDLWQSWRRSVVHNWTVDEVMDWLSHSVELPKYTKAFFINDVNGSILPRLVSS